MPWSLELSVLNGPWHRERWQPHGWQQYMKKSLLLHFSKLQNFAGFYNTEERVRGQSLK